MAPTPRSPRMPPFLLDDAPNSSSSSSSSAAHAPPRSPRAAALPSPTRFKPQRSHFDRERLEAHPSEFRGFINLLLIYAVFFVLFTVANNLAAGTSSLVSVDLLRTMMKDIVWVGVADLCVFLFTFTAFALQRAIAAGFVPRWLGLVLPHVLHSALFAMSAAFIYYWDFEWVQSGSLMMHTIVLYMKMHSYTATNRQLADDRHNERPDSKVHYPHNITLGNFVDFLLVPTLVYEPDYPRTEHGVRLGYLVEKGVLCLAAMSLLYIVIADYIKPALAKIPEQNLVQSVILLSLPFMIAYLLVFFIVFECVCNFMAECTRFADRSFYDDWWNSTSFDEFSRKWNKPVHEWLLRHIYLESMRMYKMSKLNASIGTFFFSMVLHELALSVAGRSFRPYITVLAMCQLPLISIMRHPMIKGTRIGNLFFWFSQVWGVPMLTILYAREHYGVGRPDLATIGSFVLVIIGSFSVLLAFRWLMRSRGTAAHRHHATHTHEHHEPARTHAQPAAAEDAPASSPPTSPGRARSDALPKNVRSPYTYFKHELKEELDPDHLMSSRAFAAKATEIWNDLDDASVQEWEDRFEREVRRE